ncbi:MAG: thioredoxin family protein [Rhodospirillales bacterium]|nr:thioredoxin family protein [Alphaproteobacteria bacterium]USO04221.1 MAG: thioredoxin family protein [Rhodospirillales bacterium]
MTFSTFIRFPVLFALWTGILMGTFFWKPVSSYAGYGDGGNQTPHVSIRLVADKTKVTGGEKITLGIEQEIETGWHTYWINPGDSGTPARVSWTLPKGFKVSEPAWPIPGKMKMGPLVNYGYEGKVTLLQDLTLPEKLPSGPVTLNAQIDLLVCHEICIPETHQAQITLNGAEKAQASVIALARAELPLETGWEALISEENGTLEVRVIAENTAPFAKTGSIHFFPEEWGLLDNTAKPEAQITDTGLLIRQGRGERALSDVPTAKGVIVYQDPQGQKKGIRIATLVDFSSAPSSVNGILVSDISLLTALFSALLGGLILNLMPCVFPVLSMKALSLVKLKDKEISKARAHGLAYTAGVLASFAVIAGALIALKAAGAQIGWGFQLQNPLMILTLAYLLFLIGLNLSGFFKLTAGRFAGIGTYFTQKHGVTGSFATGVLAALVATPCTAPFMGIAMGFALTQPALIAMSVFLMLGFGLALPYLVLTFVPALRHLLPHPGHWMETFRQFLAFPMFASAAWLVWVLAQQTNPMGVFSALSGMIALTFMIWLAKLRPEKRAGKIVALFLMLGSLGFVISTCTLSRHKAEEGAFAVWEDWEPYTEARLNKLLREGHPVFVNMTAAWCITCKVNEKVALSTETTRKIFKEKNIRTLKGDWTNQDSEITKYLASYGRNGVPLYVYYPLRDEETGKRPEAVILPQILTTNTMTETIQ